MFACLFKLMLIDLKGAGKAHKYFSVELLMGRGYSSTVRVDLG